MIYTPEYIFWVRAYIVRVCVCACVRACACVCVRVYLFSFTVAKAAMHARVLYVLWEDSPKSRAPKAAIATAASTVLVVVLTVVVVVDAVESAAGDEAAVGVAVGVYLRKRSSINQSTFHRGESNRRHPTQLETAVR